MANRSKPRLLILLLLICLTACDTQTTHSQGTASVSNEQGESHVAEPLVITTGQSIESRFGLPPGYERISVDSTSFAHYLRTLPLKPHGTEVKYYDGRTKANRQVYEAVLDLEIGKKDLHQCADAVMRLWAEHHFEQKDYDKIHFNFTNGFRVDYNEWRKGKRMVVKGNQTYWKQSASPSTSYASFWKYLELIFTYAGTLSLAKELKPVSVDRMHIGDVFIQGGSPGHAVIVVDMAAHKTNGQKIFLLAQSYMPAQDIQILKNPKASALGPWYSVNFGEMLNTPEWDFERADLKRFED